VICPLSHAHARYSDCDYNDYWQADDSDAAQAAEAAELSVKDAPARECLHELYDYYDEYLDLAAAGPQAACPAASSAAEPTSTSDETAEFHYGNSHDWPAEETAEPAAPVPALSANAAPVVPEGLDGQRADDTWLSDAALPDEYDYGDYGQYSHQVHEEPGEEAAARVAEELTTGYDDDYDGAMSASLTDSAEPVTEATPVVEPVPGTSWDNDYQAFEEAYDGLYNYEAAAAGLADETHPSSIMIEVFEAAPEEELDAAATSSPAWVDELARELAESVAEDLAAAGYDPFSCETQWDCGAAPAPAVPTSTVLHDMAKSLEDLAAMLQATAEYLRRAGGHHLTAGQLGEEAALQR